MSADARAEAIARWVRRHPKDVRSAIASAFVASREFPIAPWVLLGEARKIQQQILLARLRVIDGVRFADIPMVVTAYQAVVGGRRKATNDPLDASFESRLRSVVDMEDDPDDEDASYKAWLRWRFEQRRRRFGAAATA